MSKFKHSNVTLTVDYVHELATVYAINAHNWIITHDFSQFLNYFSFTFFFGFFHFSLKGFNHITSSTGNLYTLFFIVINFWAFKRKVFTIRRFKAKHVAIEYAPT